MNFENFLGQWEDTTHILPPPSDPRSSVPTPSAQEHSDQQAAKRTPMERWQIQSEFHGRDLPMPSINQSRFSYVRMGQITAPTFPEALESEIRNELDGAKSQEESLIDIASQAQGFPYIPLPGTDVAPVAINGPVGLWSYGMPPVAVVSGQSRSQDKKKPDRPEPPVLDLDVKRKINLK